MSIPEYFSDLPNFSDIISKTEAKVRSDLRQRYGKWHGHSAFPDENYDAWTQRQWQRYDHFIHAARDKKLLPTPTELDKAYPISEDAPSPFSPSATYAALGLCGYKQETKNLDDVRALAQAMLESNRTDLEATFTAPAVMLSQKNNTRLETKLTFRDQDQLAETLGSLGERAAMAIKESILGHLQALSTWNSVVELLDQVDLSDEKTLMNIASDSTYEKRESSSPLCSTLLRIDHEEAMSATRLRLLFQEWRGKSAIPTQPFPSWWTTTIQREQPHVSPRILQLSSLAGLSRFEKAIVRVCRPSLHAGVPPQISLLDFEMMLLEKPTRCNKVSDSLMKAIGYHYTVVYVHFILRKLIFDRAISCTEWHTYKVHETWGKYPPGTHERKTDSAGQRLLAVMSLRKILEGDWRDHRVFWFGTRTHGLNWAKYLTLPSPATTLDLNGPKLKACLDAICTVTCGSCLSGIMDAEIKGKRLTVRTDYASRDILEDIQAVCSATRLAEELRIPEDLYCTFKPTTERQHTPTATVLGPPSTDRLESAPLAQSSHSYLRDNPPNSRPTGRSSITESTTPPPEHAETPVSLQPFLVNGAQMKLLERVLGEREGEVRWSKLINLLKRVGFRATGMGGSAYHITPIVPGGKSILLYKPHPEPSFTSTEAKAIGSRLKATFGWSIHTFVRRSEPEPEHEAGDNAD